MMKFTDMGHRPLPSMLQGANDASLLQDLKGLIVTIAFTMAVSIAQTQINPK
jgi:hypothetical protein